VLTLGWRLGAAIGPAAAGFLYDLTGAYTIPFGAAPVAVALSWLLFTLSTSRARPRRGASAHVARMTQ
jgi:cyanate permease